MSDLKVNEIKTDTIKNQAGTTALSIDTTGRPSFAKAKTPSFHVYKSDNLTVADSVETQVPFNANYFLHDWTVNGSGDLTCGTGAGGIYMIHCSGRINTSADGNVSLKLKLNGTVDATHGRGSQYCYSEYYQGMDITTMLELSDGDVLRMYLTQVTGSSRTAGNNDCGFHLKMMAYRVSA
tara:strand:+ start:1685 stop:2224 length:540 start_codon:yes stop_codon:yes gene_type:complete